jgi:DNA (cytosine-5)-methyltransferase 3A
MRVLSLFDGISCLRVALGDRVSEYSASEIDPRAIKISTKNYPDIKRLGDVKSIKTENYIGIDLLCGGSPCQDLSIANKDRKGLDGDRSGLFWTYLKILRETKPKWFILENVASMPQKDRDIITKEMGVQPVMIDAALVSAQSRKRLFWTNIPVSGLPTDQKIVLADILEPDIPAEYTTLTKIKSSRLIGYINKRHQGNRVYPINGKSICLSANGGGLAGKTGLYQISEGNIRRLSPLECERLQSLPDNYTAGVSNTARYKGLGNAFNVEVIRFILSFLPSSVDPPV